MGSIILYVFCLVFGLVGVSYGWPTFMGVLSGWHQAIYNLFLIMLVAGGFMLYVGARGLVRRIPFKSLSRSVKTGVWVAMAVLVIPLTLGLLFLWVLSRSTFTF